MTKQRTNKISEALDGRTPTWLARELGISKWRVYKYCSNDCQPDIFTLKCVSVALNVTMESLVE